MRTVRFRLATSEAIAVAVTLGGWLGLALGIFHGTQIRLTDALFPSGTADPRIVVVAIDDDSLEKKGRWPWPRHLHAEIIDKLAADGAALIGYDVLFTEPSGDPSEDAALAAALKRAGNVVLAGDLTFKNEKPAKGVAFLHGGTWHPPILQLDTPAAGGAHANVFQDTDGVVRAVPLMVEDSANELRPSLSLALLDLSLGGNQPVTVRGDGLQIGDRFVPTGPGHLLDVDFTTGFSEVPAIKVIDGTFKPGTFRGKIVLIGTSAVGLGDQKLTALNKSSGQPGVLVHANALDTMLSQAYLFPESRQVTLLAIFTLALLVALSVVFLRVWLSPAVAALLGVGFVFLAFTRFDSGHVANLIYPPIGIVLAFLAALTVRYVVERRERRRVTDVFGRYVARDVVDEVLASPEGAVATLAGASRPLTILFADLRGFTSASEKATPPEVVAALNVYLDAMTRAVIDEQGTVDKFMGDCVMAFWGAPRPEPQHAVRAARAAMKMLDYIDEAIARSPEAALLKVKGCGVGLSTGEAVVGNIGSSQRLDYTVIGDTVNTASRLCGVAGPGEIVVTDGCARRLGDEFRLSELPPLVVKGKVDPLRVHQLLRAKQEAKTYAAGETLDATEEKGHFEPVVAPPVAAGYAPVEPQPEPPPA